MSLGPLTQLRLDHVGDVAIVRFLGTELVDRDQIQRMGDELVSLVDAGERRVLIDFTQIRRFASFALGKLVTFKKKIEASGGEVRMCGLHPDFLKLFEIIRFTDLFRIYDSEQAALAEFAGAGPSR